VFIAAIDPARFFGYFSTDMVEKVAGDRMTASAPAGEVP
jgi:hypothetical protein